MRPPALLLICVVAGPAGAQTMQSVAWPVAAGSRVRVESPALGGRQTGSVVLATADSLAFQAPANDVIFRIPASSISKMQIARGTHTNKARGALYGLLIGGGTGALLAAAAYHKTDCREICIFPDSRGFDAALGGTLGAIAGTVVGAIVGSHAVDTWVPVAVPRP